MDSNNRVVVYIIAGSKLCGSVKWVLDCQEHNSCNQSISTLVHVTSGNIYVSYG